MSKLLDLRNKGIEKVKVVEHIIFKPRSFKYEMARMFIVIFTVAIIGFGISNADDLNPFSQNTQDFKNFSAVGIVYEINVDSIKINPARIKDDYAGYTISLQKLEKVETNTFNQLNTSDIQAGDKIIVKGNKNIVTGEFFAIKIISFSDRYPDTENVLAVAEPSLNIENILQDATNTIEVFTSTETSTTNDSGAVENIIGDIVDTIQNIAEVITDTVTETIENVTGGEQPTNNEDPSESSDSNTTSSDSSSSDSSSSDSSSSDSESNDSGAGSDSSSDSSSGGESSGGDSSSGASE